MQHKPESNGSEWAKIEKQLVLTGDQRPWNGGVTHGGAEDGQRLLLVKPPYELSLMDRSRAPISIMRFVAAPWTGVTGAGPPAARSGAQRWRTGVRRIPCGRESAQAAMSSPPWRRRGEGGHDGDSLTRQDGGDRRGLGEARVEVIILHSPCNTAQNSDACVNLLLRAEPPLVSSRAEPSLAAADWSQSFSRRRECILHMAR